MTGTNYHKNLNIISMSMYYRIEEHNCLYQSPTIYRQG